MAITFMNLKLIEFVSSLKDLEDFLNKHECSFWANKIKNVKSIAEQSNAFCIDLFLSYFGSMGSLNDLVIDASSSINDDFHEKLNKAYQLALVLK